AVQLRARRVPRPIHHLSLGPSVREAYRHERSTEVVQPDPLAPGAVLEKLGALDAGDFEPLPEVHGATAAGEMAPGGADEHKRALGRQLAPEAERAKRIRRELPCPGPLRLVLVEPHDSVLEVDVGPFQ